MTATRTVVGVWLLPDGATPATGHILFAPDRRVVLLGPPAAILTRRPLRASLDQDGQVSVDLPCTGTGDTSPAEWAWAITEQLDGASERTWTFALPEAAEPLDLATVSPVSPP